jgi:molybdopterin converting factor small subunit
MNMIKLDLMFFGSLKMHFGSHLQITVPEGLRVGELMHMLKEKIPDAAAILASCQVAVNAQLEKEDFIIADENEIAILPPFSGG